MSDCIDASWERGSIKPDGLLPEAGACSNKVVRGLLPVMFISRNPQPGSSFSGEHFVRAGPEPGRASNLSQKTIYRLVRAHHEFAEGKLQPLTQWIGPQE